MKSLTMFALPLFAFLLLGTLNAPASVVLNLDIPIDGAVFNPCNGETLTFTGIDHFVLMMTFDGSGGFHAHAHDNIHVSASGNLGNSYEGNQENNDLINGRIGVEQSFGLTFSEISEGAAPNFEMHILQHITINPNGTMAVSFTNATSSCRA